MESNLNLSLNILISYINTYYSIFIIVYGYFFIARTELTLVITWCTLCTALTIILMINLSIYLKQISRNYDRKLKRIIEEVNRCLSNVFEKTGMKREKVILYAVTCKITTGAIILILLLNYVLENYEDLILEQLFYFSVYTVMICTILIPYYVIACDVDI